MTEKKGKRSTEEIIKSIVDDLPEGFRKLLGDDPVAILTKASVQAKAIYKKKEISRFITQLCETELDGAPFLLVFPAKDERMPSALSTNMAPGLFAQTVVAMHDQLTSEEGLNAVCVDEEGNITVTSTKSERKDMKDIDPVFIMPVSEQ